MNTVAASEQWLNLAVPFETPFWQSPPDTVLVRFQSSLWQDSSVIYVGSELLIDEVTFKSQPLATISLNNLKDENILIFPNPSTNRITVLIDKRVHADFTLNIYNAVGELVLSESLKQNQQDIDVGNLSNGMYLVEIRS